MLLPMLNRTLFLTLLLVSGSAFAEWRFITEGSLGNKFFIDLATIRKDGNMRTAWMKLELKLDAKTSEIDDWRSARSKIEIDCKKELIRLVATTTFAEPSLLGKVVTNKDFPYEPFTPIAPETINSTFMQIMCR